MFHTWTSGALESPWTSLHCAQNVKCLFMMALGELLSLTLFSSMDPVTSHPACGLMRWNCTAYLLCFIMSFVVFYYCILYYVNLLAALSSGSYKQTNNTYL